MFFQYDSDHGAFDPSPLGFSPSWLDCNITIAADGMYVVDEPGVADYITCMQVVQASSGNDPL